MRTIRKNLKDFILISIAVMAGVVLLTSCQKDAPLKPETAKYTIAGEVIYNGGLKDPDSSRVYYQLLPSGNIDSVTAGMGGVYKVPGLSAGTYSVYARYNAFKSTVITFSLSADTTINPLIHLR